MNPLVLFMFPVCHDFLSVHCGWERANLLGFLYVTFSCVFITFPCGVLGMVLDCINSLSCRAA